MAKKTGKIGDRSLMENMGAQLVGRVPVSLKNKNKFLLVRGADYLETNGYVKIGDSANSGDQARAILIGKGIEPVDNLDDTNGMEFSLMIRGGNDYEKIEPEDLDVYKKVLVAPFQSNSVIVTTKPGEITIQAPRKDDDPIFVQDPNLTENQQEDFIKEINSVNENTPDPVQTLEVAVQAESESSGCKVAHSPEYSGEGNIEENTGQSGNVTVKLAKL